MVGVLLLLLLLLLPPHPPPPPLCRSTVAQLAATTPELSTLNSLLAAAGLQSALGADFAGTVWAPVNDAFTALLTNLTSNATALTANTDTLSALLRYHVTPSEDGRWGGALGGRRGGRSVVGARA